MRKNHPFSKGLERPKARVLGTYLGMKLYMTAPEAQLLLMMSATISPYGFLSPVPAVIPEFSELGESTFEKKKGLESPSEGRTVIRYVLHHSLSPKEATSTTSLPLGRSMVQVSECMLKTR